MTEPVIKERRSWSHGDRVQVAHMLLNPEANGGWVVDFPAEQLAHLLAKRDVPMWAVFHRGRLAGTLSLDPCRGGSGLLHFTHTGALPRRYHWPVMRKFLKRHSHLCIYAVVTRRALARLAITQGFRPAPIEALEALFPDELRTLRHEGHTPYALLWPKE